MNLLKCIYDLFRKPVGATPVQNDVKSILTMDTNDKIEYFKVHAKPYHHFMTINVSTWHMKIFPDFHQSFSEIDEKLDYEKKNPSGYSTVQLVYDLKLKKIVYSKR